MDPKDIEANPDTTKRLLGMSHTYPVVDEVDSLGRIQATIMGVPMFYDPTPIHPGALEWYIKMMAKRQENPDDTR